MKYICTSCNYSYDTAFWDEEENVNIWKILEYCPVCEEYDTFQWIIEEVNYIEWEEDLQSIEIDHFPEVFYEDGKLIVTVWNEIHPMWEDHRIASILLCDEYWDILEEKYLDIEEEAKVEFEFDDLDEFEIRIKCSLHWVWGKKFLN